MAEFNSCAHLLDNIDEATEEYCKVKEWENYDVSPLNEMLKMQNQLQVNKLHLAQIASSQWLTTTCCSLKSIAC